jgi:hypothetical protein
VRPAISVTRHGCKTTWRTKLDSGTESIAHRKADKGSSTTIFHELLALILVCLWRFIMPLVWQIAQFVRRST